jgi:hypothetical protein
MEHNPLCEQALTTGAPGSFIGISMIQRKILYVGIADNEEGWKEDEEFARQRIAGNNPILIKLLTVKSCSSPFVMTMMMISFILLLSHFRFNILLQRKI